MGQTAENGELRDLLAEAIYAGGDEAEWLTTVDGSPNSASYELADRVLAALPFDVVVEQGWRCEHGDAGPYADRGEFASCDDPRAVPIYRLVVTRGVGDWTPETGPIPPGKADA